jgi:hypothetical protein
MQFQAFIVDNRGVLRRSGCEIGHCLEMNTIGTTNHAQGIGSLKPRPLLRKALRAEVWCFIVITIVSWLRELSTPGGNILVHPEASFACWLGTLICTVLLWRSHRRLAAAGLVAFLFWGALALYPRL